MRGPRLVTIVALAALVVTAAAARGVQEDSGQELVPGDAAAYYGAWALYRNLAVWFGKRAMAAELRYREAITR